TMFPIVSSRQGQGPLAAHHVDGSLAAGFRWNLVSLCAATRTRLHVGVSRGGIGGLLVRRDSQRIIIAVAAVPIVIVPEGYDQAADTVASREASAAEVSGAQAATDATATHGTAEMAPAKTTAHMSAAAKRAPHVSAAAEPTSGERKRVSGQSPTESGSRHQDDHGLT